MPKKRWKGFRRVRNFNGKLYKLHSVTSVSDAKKHAKELRREGYFVRTSVEKIEGYKSVILWVRRKK